MPNFSEIFRENFKVLKNETIGNTTYTYINMDSDEDAEVRYVETRPDSNSSSDHLRERRFSIETLDDLYIVDNRLGDNGSISANLESGSSEGYDSLLVFKDLTLEWNNSKITMPEYLKEFEDASYILSESIRPRFEFASDILFDIDGDGIAYSLNEVGEALGVKILPMTLHADWTNVYKQTISGTFSNAFPLLESIEEEIRIGDQFETYDI
jgi:hypothetical protein